MHVHENNLQLTIIVLNERIKEGNAKYQFNSNQYSILQSCSIYRYVVLRIIPTTLLLTELKFKQLLFEIHLQELHIHANIA